MPARLQDLPPQGGPGGGVAALDEAPGVGAPDNNPRSLSERATGSHPAGTSSRTVKVKVTAWPGLGWRPSLPCGQAAETSHRKNIRVALLSQPFSHLFEHKPSSPRGPHFGKRSNGHGRGQPWADVQLLCLLLNQGNLECLRASAFFLWSDACLPRPQGSW